MKENTPNKRKGEEQPPKRLMTPAQQTEYRVSLETSISKPGSQEKKKMGTGKIGDFGRFGPGLGLRLGASRAAHSETETNAAGCENACKIQPTGQQKSAGRAKVP